MTTDLTGKIILITGANSGIGLVAAQQLAAQGAHLVLACRRPEAAADAVRQIRQQTPAAQIDLLTLDLSSLESVRQAAKEALSRWPAIDVLLNNAGIAPLRRSESRDGIEMTLATNHLGPFLLTLLLLPAIKATQGRIVNVASHAHKQAQMNFDDLEYRNSFPLFKVYAQSKLANILFTRALAKRLQGTGVTVNALHPGAVKTNIWPGDHWYEKLATAVIKLFLISPEEGAKTSIYLASSPEVQGISGEYFYQCKAERPSRLAQDEASAERLWTWSERVAGVSFTAV